MSLLEKVKNVKHSLARIVKSACVRFLLIYCKREEVPLFPLRSLYPLRSKKLYRKERPEGEGRNKERRGHKGYFQPVFSTFHPL
jgi:hypothetical protein